MLGVRTPSSPQTTVSWTPERRSRLPWRKERRFGGSPVIAKIPGRATVSGARFALFFTAAAWLAYVTEQGLRLGDADLGTRTFIETIVYLLIVTLLTASAAAYLLARLGYFERIRVHQRVPRSTIDDCVTRAMPTITMLIPSYREDERVIRQTLLSAALQEYPNLRVVLLVDDPPNASEPEFRNSLERARALPAEITAQLRGPRERFEGAYAAFKANGDDNRAVTAAELRALAAEYEAATRWFREAARTYPREDHSDEFLIIEVFQRMANDLHTTANAIHAAASDSDATISRKRAAQLYARLMRIFQAEILSFERKQFASLSHEPNKAMNLNSYLGLMGGSYCIVRSPGGRVLLPAEGREPDLVIPASDYVLTLDADSILLPEYCLRLAYFMEQPENDDVAVAQTPYSAYLGAPSSLERIAGATTDIQHIVHQGLTHYNATFWVGANALIRRRALDQLEEREFESGFVIKRYIRDRTVIEDTESSIDLRAKGWRLYNYPERLSYSATPPDFGALVIQRQRWANGGLVILPKLLKLLGKREAGVSRPGLAEMFLRTNYLASISWASFGLLLLLFYPFDSRLLTRFGAITAVPYFWAMSSDLRREGYSRLDVARIYGFNLLLLPVNLMGTIQSIVQSIGGQKMAFARTPKVANRTVAPLTYVLVPLLLTAWSAHTLGNDWDKRAYIHGGFAALNACLAAYACIVLIGLQNVVVDVFMNLRAFVYRPVRPRTKPSELPHWASVLYVGGSVPEEVERNAPLAVALAAEDRFEIMERSSHPAVVNQAPASLAQVETGVAR